MQTASNIYARGETRLDRSQVSSAATPHAQLDDDRSKVGAGRNPGRQSNDARAAIIPGPESIGCELTLMSFHSHLLTNEAAYIVRRRPQTLRKAYAVTGSFLGVVPKKVGRRLLWPRDALMRLIEGTV